MKLFHATSESRFILYPLESRKCDTGCLPIPPRASPTSFGNHEEQHNQPILNKEKVRPDSDWSESEGNILESGKWKLKDD